MENSTNSMESQGEEASKRGAWIGIGLALGAGIGAAMDNIGLGIALGLCFGLAIEARRSRRAKD